MTGPHERPNDPLSSTAPALPDVDSPPREDVLDGVPSTEEIIEHADSAEEILGQQPSVEDVLQRRR
jgi:hypothetical protein